MDSFETFWPEFVRAHANKTTRLLHVGGAIAAVGVAGLALATKSPRLLLLAVPVAVVPGLLGHALFDDPASAAVRRDRGHMWWAFRANVRMLLKTVAGEMDAEVERATAPPPSTRANGGSHVAVNVPTPSSPLN